MDAKQIGIKLRIQSVQCIQQQACFKHAKEHSFARRAAQRAACVQLCVTVHVQQQKSSSCERLCVCLCAGLRALMRVVASMRFVADWQSQRVSMLTVSIQSVRQQHSMVALAVVLVFPVQGHGMLLIVNCASWCMLPWQLNGWE